MKTVILCHADGDGMCSGAIALARFPDATVFFTKPVSLLPDLKAVEGDQIVITDIALAKKYAPQVMDLFKAKSKMTKILYFDHHGLPEGIKDADVQKFVAYFHEEGVSASELIYKHFRDDIPKERVWAAIYGAISDYSARTPFIEDVLNNWDVRALDFEVGTLVLGTKIEKFTGFDSKRDLVKLLSKGGNPSEFSGLVNAAKVAVKLEFELYGMIKKNSKVSGVVGYVQDIHTFGFRSASALFAATATNTPLGLGVHTLKEKGVLDITLRARDKTINLMKLAEAAGDFVGGSGGGLPEASGARIPIGTLDKFIAKLNDMLKKDFKPTQKLEKFDGV